MTVSSSASCLRGLVVIGFLAASMLAGCSPEGAGTIKIENPEAVREKFAPVGKATGKETPKQAKAKELEEEAAKKHGKLN